MTPVILANQQPEAETEFAANPYTRMMMASGADNRQFNSYKLSWGAMSGIALFSVLYFADIFLRASQKCFWFDELFTVYLCRLSDFKSVWAAVAHGADFNPPLFYLLEWGSQMLFGPGLIATRLPSTIGVWLFCICLFLFVARRAGIISGFIAGVFPFFTLAQYYAYEARAHGIVLGWCGLALVCWQRNAEGRARYFWLAGFGLSLVGALLTHVYAVYLLVPFAVAEIYNLIDKKRPNWGNLAVMALALASVTLTVYLPLFRVYRTTVTMNFKAPSLGSLPRFLIDVIGQATIILFLFLVISAANAMRGNRRAHAAAAMPGREMVLAAGFACIPLAGLIGCQVSHGPFIARYFLSSVAGYAIFAGFASSHRHLDRWTAKALALCMFLLMSADLGATIYLRMKHRILIFEPSSELTLGTTPSDPMAMYDTLSTTNSGLDILVVSDLEYIYFFTYAPPSVVSHLYFGASTSDLFRSAYERLARGARIDLKLTSFDPFLATRNRFLLYESRNSAHMDNSSYVEAVQAIARAGYRVKSARADAGGILYEYEK
jgi:hypothetical protein